MDNQVLKLQENYKNIGSSTAKFKIETDNSVEIEIKPLDEFLDKISKLALIKIDVEGMETDVLKKNTNHY